MKPLLFPTIFILLTTTTSCRKVYDYIHDHPDAHDSLCQVTAIRFRGPDAVEYDITYDPKGNPVTMMNTNRLSSYALDRYFRYDRWGRLSDYMGAYPGNFGAIYWKKYAYIRPNFVTDTTMYYETGDVRDPSSPLARNSAEYYIYGYTLDAHGRIVKIWSIPNDPPHTPVLQSELHYDANGNLPLPDSTLTYDDKVNVYRTNKVWQFIFRDYSRNNIIKNDHFFFPTYNTFGLPLNILNLQAYNNYIFDIDNQNPELYITYACSVPKGPINY